MSTAQCTPSKGKQYVQSPITDFLQPSPSHQHEPGPTGHSAELTHSPASNTQSGQVKRRERHNHHPHPQQQEHAEDFHRTPKRPRLLLHGPNSDLKQQSLLSSFQQCHPHLPMHCHVGMSPAARAAAGAAAAAQRAVAAVKAAALCLAAMQQTSSRHAKTTSRANNLGQPYKTAIAEAAQTAVGTVVNTAANETAVDRAGHARVEAPGGAYQCTTQVHTDKDNTAFPGDDSSSPGHCWQNEEADALTAPVPPTARHAAAVVSQQQHPTKSQRQQQQQHAAIFRHDPGSLVQQSASQCTKETQPPVAAAVLLHANFQTSLLGHCTTPISSNQPIAADSHTPIPADGDQEAQQPTTKSVHLAPQHGQQQPPGLSVENCQQVRYRGVRKTKLVDGTACYSAVIRYQSRKVYLGRFYSQQAAARAYDCAKVAIKGTSADTNFDVSLYSAADIQAARNRLGLTKDADTALSKRKCRIVQVNVTEQQQQQQQQQQQATAVANTACQGMAGRSTFAADEVPGVAEQQRYKGVYAAHKSAGYNSFISHHSRLLYVGYFKSRIAAARAWDCAKIAIKGTSAATNFHASTYSAADIQAAWNRLGLAEDVEGTVQRQGKRSSRQQVNITSPQQAATAAAFDTASLAVAGDSGGHAVVLPQPAVHPIILRSRSMLHMWLLQCQARQAAHAQLAGSSTDGKPSPSMIQTACVPYGRYKLLHRSRTLEQQVAASLGTTAKAAGKAYHVPLALLAALEAAGGV
eukprot:jgi/Chrzof1/2080/Cz11g02020.t1